MLKLDFIRFYAPDDDGNSGDSGGNGNGATPVGDPPPAGNPPAGTPPANIPAKIKVGDQEMTVEDAAKEIQTHRQRSQQFAPLFQVKDRDSAMKAVEGMFPKPIDPNDVKGRLEQAENQLRDQQNMQQAMATLYQLQTTYGADFKGDAMMLTLKELGIPFDPQNFGRHVELAHKAGQYDVLKAGFDAKLKAGIEAGVQEALKKGAQREDAGGVHGNGNPPGNTGDDSWKGDPVEVAARKGLKIGS